MTYRIQGIDAARFIPLFGLPDEELAANGVVRMRVTEWPGFPCRITLDDAQPGQTVLLLNHVSQDRGPYRASHAIFVTEGALEPAVYEDTVPPALDRRILSLRAFDAHAMMVDAELVQPGCADDSIRRMFDQSAVRYIHAHNAVRGCFSAKVERTLP